MLKYSHVSIAYQNKPIVKGFDAEFDKGKITAIIGPNGSGKTTLLQALNKSAKLVEGEITANGKNIMSMPPKERAKRIAYLPQMREHIPSLPVRMMVEHGRFPYMGFGRLAREEDRRIIERAMRQTCVLEYENCNLDTLSGGIRQRVFLAMILAQDSEIVALDEPTTFLDMKAQAEFLSMIRELKELGKTVIVVLHDLHQAISISDEILVMQGGQLIFKGIPEKCMESGVVESVFGVTSYAIEVDKKTKYFFE